jgi:lactate dehydrogenase-like 2-hydroxyacid dehydrogenase
VVEKSSPVIMVGTLRDQIVIPLRERYGAPSLEEVDARAAGAVKVAVTSGVWGVRAEHMDRLPNLEAIVNFGVGYDGTDVHEARRRGVVVSNTPGVLTDCVADTTVWLVLDVMRRFAAADRFVRRGEWAKGHTYPLTRQVTGCRVGIVGLGRIGQAVAHRLVNFETDIAYTGRSQKAGVPYRFVPSLIDLASEVDVLVVAAAGGDSSRGLVGREVLDALGPDGFLVNVSRGSVVDEAELVTALEEGRLGGAGLDVFADEPRVPEALLAREDVSLLPHVGSATVQTRQAMADLTLANVEQFLREGTLITPVG